MPACRTAAPTPAKGPLPWRAAPPALCLGLQAGPGRARPAARGPRDGSRRAPLPALTRPRSLPHLNNQTARARQQGRLLPHHVLQGRPHLRRHQRRVSALRWRLLPKRHASAPHRALRLPARRRRCRLLGTPHSASTPPETTFALRPPSNRSGNFGASTEGGRAAALGAGGVCEAAAVRGSACRLDGTTGAAPALSGCSQTDSCPLAA